MGTCGDVCGILGRLRGPAHVCSFTERGDKTLSHAMIAIKLPTSQGYRG